ncbi:MAG: peptide-methionine (R)-S-oxide reductase MsrB [Mariprofundales bacterium]|nr:peptide-methionine (R)-S-oxide reductase MsrB [Mariprofundales bacterium]
MGSVSVRLFGCLLMCMPVVVCGDAAAQGVLEGSSMETMKMMEKSGVEGASEATALFAGGCFWCMERPFEQHAGVREVISGYTAGSSVNPTYHNYADGGHIEAVMVHYDPNRVSYSELLQLFWQQIDPTDSGGQFVDRGHQYSSAIFYQSERERRLAERSRLELINSGRFSAAVVTPILPAQPFYPAEEYHQDYYRKNPVRYWYYRSRSGRDQFLQQVWGSFTDHVVTDPVVDDRGRGEGDLQGSGLQEMDLRERLTPLQYRVTQESGTEPPFDNLYWREKRQGIYVDLLSGEPLFSSKDKFDSGTGWPSFSRPLVADSVVERVDRGWFSTRIEVRSRRSDSHLGHLFDDGPPPTGKRYCINSAALRFIPKEQLEEQGLGYLLSQFQE